MKQKEHTVIISLGSNEQQEASLAAAREQLTQLLTEAHFTSAIWTVPIDHSPFLRPVGSKRPLAERTIDHSPLTIDHSPQSTRAAANNGQCSMVNGQSKNYLNQLCKGTTALGEGLLCEVLKELEVRLGRTKNEDGIVVIDLDLLQYDEQRHHLRDWERNYVKDLISEL